MKQPKLIKKKTHVFVSVCLKHEHTIGHNHYFDNKRSTDKIDKQNEQ